jgi:L-2,4-diaminobutyric acid acetyltransferase
MTFQDVEVRAPEIRDGPEIWRLVQETERLDKNSLYYYLLWCRDFSATSLVAHSGRRLVGFITGYIKQDDPTTLVAWQIATAEDIPIPGLGGQLLTGFSELAIRHGATFVEGTVNPDNRAMIMGYRRLADRYGTNVVRNTQFGSELFNDGHDREVLYRIGPLRTQGEMR